MMSFPVAKMNDPMLGVDFHDMIVPPAPAVVKFTPHVVAAKIGWVADSSALVPTVLINNMMAANQFHDIKNLIPHVPPGPNVLLAIIIPFSSSKIMLGSSTVLVNNKPIGVGPVPILNCADPLSMPTGAIIPITNVFAGVSLADMFMALATMLVEMAISYLANLAGGAIGNRVAGALSRRAASRVTATIYSRVTAREGVAVVQGLGREVSERVVIAVEREVGERLTVGMSRESAERASFLFTERATRESFEVANERVTREAVAVATEEGGVVAAREVTEEMGASVTRETYERGASEASEAMTGKVAETMVGNTAGNAASDAAEGLGQGLLGVPAGP